MISRENINSFWASLIIEELVRSGVELFCISPGSRSTPLTVAAARHPKSQCQVCHDERGAAFLALGYGKAAGKPAALICTSGTAAANYFPAVIEASMDETPLILLTADRPPELLDAGANQTIFQDHLYGDYVRWSKTMPAPCEEISPRYVLTTIDQAVHRSLAAPGPVHLNCRFREPLAPSPKEFEIVDDPRLKTWEQGDKPFTTYKIPAPGCSQDDIDRITEILNNTQNGLVILGRQSAPGQRLAQVRKLVAKLGWPVHADIASGFRLGAATWPVLDELMLQATHFFKDAAPDVVLHLGGSFISKRLQSRLEKSRPSHYILAHENNRRIDPGHIITERLTCAVGSFCKHAAARLKSRPPRRFPETEQIHSAIEKQPENDNLSEPALARLVSQHLSHGHALFLSNSQPIRDMSEFAVLDGPAPIVGSNRGASGIDGVIASAIGFARGLEKPVTLIIGDIAFLHDLNSLSLLKSSPQPVIIICLNNNGGGIFSRLPISDFPDVFDAYFTTPHNLSSFEHAAKLFGTPWMQPTTIEEFKTAIKNAWESARSCIIEVSISPQNNTALRSEIRTILHQWKK